jgi:hypothetical protein
MKLRFKKLKSSEVEQLKSSSPFNPSTFQPFNLSTFRLFTLSTLLVAAAALAAAAMEPRTWELPMPAAADVFAEPADLEWSRGESVELAYSGGTLAPGQTARWEVAAGTNLWLDEPGAGFSWSLAPTQTCLPAGRYAGRIAVYSVSGGTTTFHRVAALQSIRVHAGVEGFDDVAPVVPLLSEYATTSWVAEVERALSASIASNAASIRKLENQTNGWATMDWVNPQVNEYTTNIYAWIEEAQGLPRGVRAGSSNHYVWNGEEYRLDDQNIMWTCSANGNIVFYGEFDDGTYDAVLHPFASYWFPDDEDAQSDMETINDYWPDDYCIGWVEILDGPAWTNGPTGDQIPPDWEWHETEVHVVTNVTVRPVLGIAQSNEAAIAANAGDIASNAAAIATNAETIAALQGTVGEIPTNSFPISAAMEEQQIRMDLFDLAFTPALAETGTSTGAVVQADSIMVAPVATSNYMGYLLTPTIYAMSSETNTVSYSVNRYGVLSTNALLEVFYRPTDAINGMSATLGTTSKAYWSLPMLTNSALGTNWVYSADASGSLRAAFDDAAGSPAAGGEWQYYEDGDANPDWVFGTNWNFRCLSKGRWYQLTLVTPRHAVGAKHVTPATGTTVIFGDGATHTVAATRDLGGDRCLVRFAQTSAVPPALMIDADAAWHANLTLPANASGVPGLRVLTFHNGSRAGIDRVRTSLDTHTLDFHPDGIEDRDWIAGDSSSPIFLLAPDTDRPILLSTAWYTRGAGGGGGGPNWCDGETWAAILATLAEWGDDEIPERYDLSPWPAYGVPPAP